MNFIYLYPIYIYILTSAITYACIINIMQILVHLFTTAKSCQHRPPLTREMMKIKYIDTPNKLKSFGNFRSLFKNKAMNSEGSDPINHIIYCSAGANYCILHYLMKISLRLHLQLRLYFNVFINKRLRLKKDLNRILCSIKE